MAQSITTKEAAKLSNNSKTHKVVDNINTVVMGCCCDKAKKAAAMRNSPSKSRYKKKKG